MKKLAILTAVVCTFALMGQDSMSVDLTTPESAKVWVLDGAPKKQPALKFGFDEEKSAFGVDNNDPKRRRQKLSAYSGMDEIRG